MSIRVLFCALFVLGFSIYAWRDWFTALCGSIVLMAVLEHPDMPRSILGIFGFNLWNILFANVVGGWLAQRHREGSEWDMPKWLKVGLIFYCGVVICAGLRLLANPTVFYEGSSAQIILGYLMNPLKFLLPAILFYDGCRTRERVVWAVGAVVLLYFLLSIQVIRHMGLHFEFSGSEFSSRANKVIRSSVGYHRVDMSMMLAGASWAVIAFSRIIQRRILRWAIWGAAGLILLAQAMTGGRAGYVTWCLIGLSLCLFKWRKMLLWMPMAALVVIMFLPGVKERMLSGFGGRMGSTVYQTDSAEITSGRTKMWPYVIEKIKDSPTIGYGRLAMLRTGLAELTLDELGEVFGHPHNAYLELLLDNGVIGFVCVMPLCFMVVRRSFSLFVDPGDPILEAAGGAALALLLALLFAGIGAQSFYPREGVVGMWAAIGIAMRVWVERERSRMSDTPIFGQELLFDTPEEMEPVEVSDSREESVAQRIDR